MADANRSFERSIHHLPLKGPSPTEKGAAASPVVLCGAVGAPYDVTQTSGNKISALRENLLQHMEAPVKFVETINHAYEKQGARLFVEFGPRATCGKLVRQILAKRAEEVEVVSLGADMNNTELGLRKAIAHLAVLGADLLTFDPWAAPSALEASERSPFEHMISAPSFVGKKRKAELQRVMNDGFLLGPTGASGSVRAEHAELQAAKRELEAERRNLESQKIALAAERAKLLQSPALCTLGDQPAAVHTVPAKSESGAGREAEEIKEREKGELAKHQEECNALHQLLEEKNGHMAQIQSIDARVLDCLARNSLSSASTQPSASRPVLSKGVLKKDESIQNGDGEATLHEGGWTSARKPSPPRRASALPTRALPHRSIERSSEPRVQELPRASSAQPAGLPVAELLPASPARPAVLPATDALTVVYRVMADKTGYDASMIDEEMDLEADLGIDSIKRVEILGAAQEILGVQVQDLDALGRTRTVGEVVAFLSALTQSYGEPQRDPGVSGMEEPLGPASGDAVGVVMTIISDKTGYELDMVSAEMDLESDLGIDSIKRVEILGAAQEALGITVRDLDALGRTKTVEEVIAFLRREMEGTRKAHAQAAPRYDAAPQARVSHASTNVPPAPQLPRASLAQPVVLPALELPHTSFATPAALPAATPNVPATAMTTRSMPDALTVVYRIMADKTGYDVSMIGEEMDLEAGLGIDSIKRVEILGAAQEMLG